VPLPKFTKRRQLIKNFKACGFTGPHSGAKHPFMRRGKLTVPIPNPHEGEDEYPRWFVKRILEQADISEEEWPDA
jgi:hypothetical protein